MSRVGCILERLQDILPEDDFLSIVGVGIDDNVGDGCVYSGEQVVLVHRPNCLEGLLFLRCVLVHSCKRRSSVEV